MSGSKMDLQVEESRKLVYFKYTIEYALFMRGVGDEVEGGGGAVERG